MTLSRRGVLAAAAGLASSASAGCLGLGGGGRPPLAEAAGVVPTSEGYLVGGTTGRDSLREAPLGTFVAGLDDGGGVRFRRHHGPDEWPGTDRVTACCRLGDGALLVGATTREAVIVDDVLVHAVDAAGRTRWRRTLPAATRAVAAAGTARGAVVAAVDEAADPPACLVVALNGAGEERWRHRAARRVPATVRATGGPGSAVVAGHATGRADAVPWLLALSGGDVTAGRRYEAADLSGWRVGALLGPGPDRSLLVPLVPGTTEGASGQVLALDGAYRVTGRASVTLADDLLRADDDDPGRDRVRLVGALPAADGGLAAALGEGGWTTVATFDADNERAAETVRQARTVGVTRDRGGALLLSGSRRVEEGVRRAWAARLDTAATLNLHDVGRWTATFPVG